jgi:hypothetical protein
MVVVRPRGHDWERGPIAVRALSAQNERRYAWATPIILPCQKCKSAARRLLGAQQRNSRIQLKYNLPRPLDT